MVSVQFIMAKKHEKTVDEEADEVFGPDPEPKAAPAKSITHHSSEPKQENRQPTLEIIGEQVSEGKNQTRLFQTGPFQKRWMTKSEALEQKFYWKDED
jgi:hypothetical protein